MLFELGKKARDKITGFEGILIGHFRYLTGCDQYGIVPRVKDGEVKGVQWFDEGRIEILGDGFSATAVQSVKNGGPNRDAPC